MEFGEKNNNHVGIDINGHRSTLAAPALYFNTPSGMGKKNLSLLSGNIMQVWVEYNCQEMKQNVKISAIDIPIPTILLLSLPTDLASVISNTTYIGFSESSSSIISSHYVLGWSFKMSGKAPALYLSTLPTLPQKEARKKHIARNIWVSIKVAVFNVAIVSVITVIIGHGTVLCSFGKVGA